MTDLPSVCPILLFSNAGLALVIPVAQALESAQALSFSHSKLDIALLNQLLRRKMSQSYSLSLLFKKCKIISDNSKDLVSMLGEDNVIFLRWLEIFDVLYSYSI